MKIQATSKSVYFLMEVIIVILLFALSSTVCIQVHAYAIHMQQEANATRYAIQEATSIVEGIKAGIYPEVCHAYEACTWNISSNTHTMEVMIETSDHEQGEVTIKQEDQVLLSLPFTFVEEVHK